MLSLSEPQPPIYYIHYTLYIVVTPEACKYVILFPPLCSVNSHMPSWQRAGPSLLSHGSFLRRILPFLFIWIYLLYSWISVSVTFKWGPGVLSFWRHFIFEIMFMMLLVTNDILPGYWILNSISIFIFLPLKPAAITPMPSGNGSYCKIYPELRLAFW